MIYSYDWAYAYGEPVASGTLKQLPQDFVVHELADHELTGEGEHLWLKIEKIGENTHWVADLLAKWAGVQPRDVSYAGRKDRHAVTQQWFSIYLPGRPDPETAFESESIKVLEQHRHKAKLRRGNLDGNYFKLRIRDVSDTNDVETRLQAIKASGVPNYFGDQRFGREFANVPKALELGKRRALKKRNNDIYLSAARSYVFNTIVSQQVLKGAWQGQTAPLWGRGRADEAEKALLESFAELCDMLEHAGVNQERRQSGLQVNNMNWIWEDRDLILEFSLVSGSFATSVVREFLK